MAAVLMQYAREELGPEEALMIKHTAKMRAVLHLVARQRDGFHYLAADCQSADNFFGAHPDHIKSSIKHALWKA